MYNHINNSHSPKISASKIRHLLGAETDQLTGERTNKFLSPAVPGDVDVNDLAVLIEEWEEVVGGRTCEKQAGAAMRPDTDLEGSPLEGRARWGYEGGKGGTHGR